MIQFFKKKRSFEELVRYRNALLMRTSEPQKRLYSYLVELGFLFIPEMILKPYIVDAMGLAHACVFEIDGQFHDNQQEQDDRRSAFLASHGIEVFRIYTKEVSKELVAHYIAQSPYVGIRKMNDIAMTINGFSDLLA